MILVVEHFSNQFVTDEPVTAVVARRRGDVPLPQPVIECGTRNTYDLAGLVRCIVLRRHKAMFLLHVMGFARDTGAPADAKREFSCEGVSKDNGITLKLQEVYASLHSIRVWRICLHSFTHLHTCLRRRDDAQTRPAADKI